MGKKGKKKKNHFLGTSFFGRQAPEEGLGLEGSCREGRGHNSIPKGQGDSMQLAMLELKKCHHRAKRG